MFLVSAGKYVYLNVCPAPSGCLTYETWCEEGNFKLGGGGGVVVVVRGLHMMSKCPQ